MPAAHVLLVEDEQIVRSLLAETLGDAGFSVTEAECGDDAAVLLGDRAADFGLLLTDVQMPGRLDGIALARYARLVCPELPILFMSGRPDVLLAASALGPRERFVRKPYGQAEMIRVVEGLLARP
jgi:CheY-like chemotaxis protein